MPFGPGVRFLPNWYIERRAIAVPTRMFSLVASSMKPSERDHRNLALGHFLRA